MLHASPLVAKVTARNRVNALALTHTPGILEVLQPFVGQKVINADGTILKKLRDRLPRDAGGNTSRAGWWHYSSTDYRLRVEFKLNESYDSRGSEIAMYAEQSVDLGTLQNGVLTELGTLPDLRLTYSTAEVIEARKELQAAKELVSAAQRKLFDFGEYDR